MPWNVCVCVVAEATTTDGGDGGGMSPSYLSTVRDPTLACSAPIPRKMYRLPY